ncbi:MAG TPA: BA14K family protein [Pseudolabrys sp.]|jgi:hypothetical protein
MQFLVYLTVLMVSVSTVLLEVHWLTTPAPQQSRAVQATAAQARPKIDGPSAELSPVYPTRVDAAQASPQNNTAAAVPSTTGAGPRDNSNKSPAGVPATSASESAQKAQAYAPPPKQNENASELAASSNRCDVQACASAYKSFRASDCTYQPFDGPRRVCGKAPEQRAERAQREQPQRRSWKRDDDSREVDRRSRWDVDEESGPGAVDDADDMFLFRRSRRW